jgi:hypothetical protein
MNNPMSRKLFQSREAREKLRGMGGIMASSPELAQTVAKFQDGTLVEAPSTAAERRRQGYLIFLQQMGLPDTPQNREMYTRMMERQATAQLSATPRLAGAGVDMSPTPVMPGQDAGQNALGRLRPTQFVGTSADLPPTQFDLTSPAPPSPPAPVAVEPESFFDTMRRITGEAATVAGGMGLPVPSPPNVSLSSGAVSESGAEIPVVDEFGGLPPEMTEPGGTVETGEDISIGGVLDDLGLGPALAPVRDRREEAELQEAAAAATEQAIIPQMEREMRDRAAREEALVAEERRRAVTGVQMEAEAEADDRESRNFRLRQAQERAAKELARDTDGGDGGPAPFDFDASFEQALSRVGRVMGGEGKDEDSRKKAMANLAMIGLAIAAGQSPDALTNIAQGALSGMQAMTAQEARERDLERESRLTALEMTEKAADRASAERIAAMRLGTAGEDTRQEYLYNATFSATLTGLIGEGIPAEEAATRAAAIAAQAAPNAPSAGSATVPLSTMKAAEDQARALGQTEFTFGGQRYPVRPAS